MTTELFGLVDQAAVKRTYDVLVRQGLTEVRALHARTRDSDAPTTMSGYFKSADALANSVSQLTSAKGVYLTPNVLGAGRSTRWTDRLAPIGAGDAARDMDVVSRRWLLVDLDPTRPANTSSSEEELVAACERAGEIYVRLSQLGWPDPVQAISGNGAHLLYRIELPAEDRGLVRDCLLALAQRWSNGQVEVDATVFNPARIWRLYGTRACKGAHTAERPWRMSEIDFCPDNIRPVPVEKLQALAATALPLNRATRGSTNLISRTAAGWLRVNSSFRCPICGRPDWCMFRGEGYSPKAVICPRVESNRRAGEAGWLHELRPQALAFKAHSIAITRRNTTWWTQKAQDCAADLSEAGRRELSIALGVNAGSLARLGVGWTSDERAYTFPMRAADLAVVGIRLRYLDGRKLAMKDGKEGLFVPAELGAVETLFICEGATDTAALLDLGLEAVGRPSCTGGFAHLCELVQARKPSEIIIAADNDTPGLRGAANLANGLRLFVPRVRIITAPTGVKDIREWVRSGASRDDVTAAVRSADFFGLAIFNKGRSNDGAKRRSERSTGRRTGG